MTLQDRRESRKQARRGAIARAYNRTHDNEQAFEAAVREEAKVGSIMATIFFIKLAWAAWNFWQAYKLSEVPEAPMIGEPNFGESDPDENS